MGFTVTDMEGVDPGNRFVRGSTQDADCLNCPYSRLGRPSDPVTGEGPAKPRWIIVAESPGRNEVVQQRPMVGTAGRLVQEALAKISVRREDVWWTNAILCPPIMAPAEAAEDLKRAARKACSPRLRRELAERPGLPVLTLGSHAAQELTGDARLSITQMAGACYDVDVDGTGPRVVIPSVHPASILRGGSGGGRGSGGGGHTVDLAFWNLLYDASKVNLLAQGVDIRFTDDIQTEIIDAARAQRLVEAFVADARRLGKFACDTETYVDDPKAQTALAPINAQLSAIGLATPARAISIAWAICYPNVLAPLDALFADPAVTKVFHNAIYDVPVLERHGFTIAGRIDDTLLMHHNAFPGLAHNLQRVTTQFYAAPAWKSEYRLGKGNPAELLTYNARDTLATARIEGPIYAIVKRSQAEQTYEVDLAMAHAARVMHVQGVPIHRDTNEQLRQGFRTNVNRSRDALLATADQPELRARFEDQLAFEQARKTRKHDPVDFDERLAKRLAEVQAKPFKFLLDSGDHVVAFLKASNVPLALQTASGRISTRKDVLEEYVAYPEVRALLTYRENAKLLSTFVERMFTRTYADGRVVGGFADAHDRVHPRWAVHKITGRWGSEGPQAQNWPKADKKKGRPNLRSQVIAPPGRAFVAFDAQQLEARLIALMSGDPFLLDIFHKNKDIHSEFARLVWPDFDTIPVDERKVRRDIIKRPEYCVAPGTRVLTRDLRWVPIETLAPGDDLVGFDASRAGEPFRETYFRSSTVLASRRIRQPCYRIVTTKGTVIASDEHLWVGWKRSLGHPGRQKKLFLPKNWIRTDGLRPGDVLTYTTQPWTPDTRSWSAGYLAGVYDGEGWVAGHGTGFAQNPGNVLDMTRQLLGQHGFNWIEHTSAKARIVRTEIKGGLWESLRFLGVIRPVRLLPKAAHVWENRRLRGKGDSAEVLAVEFIGEQDVIALSTSTETYIAEGFLSHNCSFYGGSVETSWKAVVRDYPNVTLAMIQRMVTLMQTRMRGVAAWHQHMLRIADRDGEIRSMFLGRRRVFPIKQFDLSEVVNFPIQGSSADLINMGLRDIMPQLPATAFPILQIHDAVVFECAEDDQDRVKALVIKSFTREATYNGNTLLFPVDARAGKSWADVN